MPGFLLSVLPSLGGWKDIETLRQHYIRWRPMSHQQWLAASGAPEKRAPSPPPISPLSSSRLIQRLSQELEVTSLLVTHDVEGGLEMCDRVAMLEGGTLRFCGTPGEFRSCSDPVVRAFVDRAAAEAALDMVSEPR
jgi:hypothetical protein